MQLSDIGLMGLAVMGENLARNMLSHGFSVSVYNRTTSVVDHFMQTYGQGQKVYGAHSLEDFLASLAKPRKILMLIRAGEPVDQMIDTLIPMLDPGDCIIDCGNSHYPDTIRRCQKVEQAGLLYVGSGVSGGGEGALKGPSMMPGGSPAAWPLIQPIFQAICAKVDGEPCCDWVGQGGAGHFVKMVHNGIEYGDMQLICEAYFLMKEYLGMGAQEQSEVFARWNEGRLKSYLIEITADILSRIDDDRTPLVEKILDTAGQKGTGKWTTIASLDEGIPLTLISEAVFSRCLSAMKDARVAASGILGSQIVKFSGSQAEKEAFLADLEAALYASKIVSYTQGYNLMMSAAKTYGWDLNLGGIALMWRGGCIIRSVFLGQIKAAFDADPNLPSLMTAPYFADALKDAAAAWRRVCAAAVLSGVPAPAFCSALSYYDGYRCPRLPANLLQAQRDYFGAHTYERIDAPRGEFFHTDWLGSGSVASSTYNA